MEQLPDWKSNKHLQASSGDSVFTRQSVSKTKHLHLETSDTSVLTEICKTGVTGCGVSAEQMELYIKFIRQPLPMFRFASYSVTFSTLLTNLSAIRLRFYRNQTRSVIVGNNGNVNFRIVRYFTVILYYKINVCVIDNDRQTEEDKH